MKMKIRKNILKIVATGIATGLAFSVSCWSVAASDSTNEAKAEETQEYDALQKIFLEINKETTEDKLLKLIEEHSVEYTAEEYNGTPKSRNYNIAFDSDVVLQKYAESGDSLEVSFNKEDMQNILMKHRSEMLCITIMEHIGIFERMSWIIRTQDITITNRVIQKAA
mgnify:CR=1 FL=1